MIREYLDGLPRLALVTANPGTPVAMVGLPDGVTGTQIVNATFVNSQAELALLKSFPHVTWPGALVQGNSIADNDFAPIILPRSGGRIRLSTNFVGSSGGSQFRDLPEMKAGEVEDTARAMLLSLNPTDSVGSLHFAYESAGTLREAMVKLGVAYKGGNVSASLDASLNSSYNENAIVAKFTQEFYTVAFDPNPSGASPFFAPTVSLNQIKQFTTPDNPPLFVSEVKYGRILVVTFRSTLSKLELEAAVKAAYAAVSGSLDASYKEKLSKVRMELLAVGATGDMSAQLVQAATPDDLVAALRAAIKSGSKYHPTTNPGAPIAFTMRYVGSRANLGPYGVAIAQMVTQASPQVVSLNAVETCKSPFWVWDGSGGGWVDTNLDFKPGDKVRFKADGTNYSGVFRDGGYGPLGWHTWEAPFEFSGPSSYPLWNRSPFALIARFGGGNNYGYDRTKWDYSSADRGKQPPSDSFFVGNSAQVTVGEVDRNSGGGTPGYGRLFLGTNDNNPTNGDANAKFFVQVCFTRKIYS